MTIRSRAMKQMKLQKFVILGFIGLYLQMYVAGNNDFETCKKDWDKLIPELKQALNNRLHMGATFNCTPFQNCSGTSCSGIALNRQFGVTVNIKHCLNPVKIGLTIVVPALHINKYVELKNNTDTIILNGIQFPVAEGVRLPLTLSVRPNIRKNGKNITLKTQIIGSAATPFGRFRRPYDGVTVLVNDKACIRKPTARPTVHSAETKNVASTTTKSVVTAAASTKAKGSSLPMTTKPSSSSKKIKSSVMTKSSTGKGKTVGKHKMKHKVNTEPHAVNTLKHSTKKSEGTQGKHEKSKGSSPLSTGEKVANSASVILLAVVAVSLLAFW